VFSFNFQLVAFSMVSIRLVMRAGQVCKPVWDMNSIIYSGSKIDLKPCFRCISCSLLSEKRQFLLMQMENEFLGAETLNSLKKLSDQRKSAALSVEAAV